MILVINGSGVMATLTYNLAQKQGHEVYQCNYKNTSLQSLCDKHKIDAIIDFSHPQQLEFVANVVKKNNIACVFATTGYSFEQLLEINELGNVAPIIQTYNTSVGVEILCQLIAKMNQFLTSTTNIEILEKHHNLKIDSPSGTALKMYEQIKLNNKKMYTSKPNMKKTKSNEIGINSLRLGNVVGEHSIYYGMGSEVIEIKHSALSKEVFAQGAITLSQKLQNKKNKSYSVTELLGV